MHSPTPTSLHQCHQYHPMALTSVVIRCFEWLVMEYISCSIPSTLSIHLFPSTYPGLRHDGSRFSRAFPATHYLLPPEISRGIPSPDGLCGPFSGFWVYASVVSTHRSNSHTICEHLFTSVDMELKNIENHN